MKLRGHLNLTYVLFVYLEPEWNEDKLLRVKTMITRLYITFFETVSTNTYFLK